MKNMDEKSKFCIEAPRQAIGATIPHFILPAVLKNSRGDTMPTINLSSEHVI
jgi:hypothetical protein